MSFEEFKSFEPYFSNNEGGNLILALAKPEIIQNPYPYYHYLYSKGPISWLPDKKWPSTGYYMIHDYAIIDELLKSTNVGGDVSHANWTDEQKKNFLKMAEINPYIRMGRNWMLGSDPPDHTKIRSLMNKVFTPSRVRELSDSIYEITNSLLDSIDSKNPFNLLAEYAYPVPVLVIAALLGVPTKDLATFKKWTKIIIITLNGQELDEQQSAEVNKTVLEMREYFGKLLKERESNPANDLISDLAKEQKTEVSQQVILDNLILLLVAGHETTMNLISNGTYHLLQNPEQISMLRDDSGLYPNAVDEALRYDSPVQFTSRRSYIDFEFNGYTIKSGMPMYLMLSSANRNTSSNPRPDVFDITREKINYLSFSRGIHYCLGAPLAKLEGKIAFETLFTRLKNLQLVEKPKYRNHVNLRGLESLILKN